MHYDLETEEGRESAIQESQRRLLRHLQTDVDPGWGACFYRAHFLCEVLHEQGERVQLQAGTAQWPMYPADKVRELLQDETSQAHTHFATVWSPDTALSQLAQSLSHLPEVHVWLALWRQPAPVIIDSGMPAVYAGMRAAFPEATPSPELPYIWATTETFPEHYRYYPEPRAMALVYRLAWRVFQPSYIPRELLPRARNEHASEPGRDG